MGHGARKSIIAVSFSIGLAFHVPSAWSQSTEAEQAAESERALTPNEVEIRAADCRLPTSQVGAISLSLSQIAPVIFAEDQLFLVLAVYGNVKGSDGPYTNLEPFPYLPKGGIGFRDIFEETTLYYVPGIFSVNKSAYALRLRPSVDLKIDYPTAFKQITENLQSQTLPAGHYALVTTDRPERSYFQLEALGEGPYLDESRFAFTVGNFLFIPVEGSDFWDE